MHYFPLQTALAGVFGSFRERKIMTAKNFIFDNTFSNTNIFNGKEPYADTLENIGPTIILQRHPTRNDERKNRYSH
jgi:hypothetical protein